MKTHMSYEQLAALVPRPGSPADWGALCELMPTLRALEHCPQDPIHHAEGNVGIHTRMVLDRLADDAHYAAGDAERRFALFVAALLHDIAKPQTTVVDPGTGRISQPGHSRRGSVDARLLLWQAGTPVELREAICRIIAVHQVPFFAFDSRRGESAEFIVRKLSWEVDLQDLVAVARADMSGRICQARDDALADIELFAELAREEGAWLGPRPFADRHTAIRYFRGTPLHPDHALFERAGARVTVMCGLPAAGKNTWVARHAADLPVVSFDDARAELGLRHGQNEGAAAHRAVDRARELLRTRRDFVWNATHLSQQMRRKTLDLLFAYDARVRIVHLEQPLPVLLQRNARRDSSLSNRSLLQMLTRWEAPLPTEAHEVVFVSAEGTR